MPAKVGLIFRFLLVNSKLTQLAVEYLRVAHSNQTPKHAHLMACLNQAI